MAYNIESVFVNADAFLVLKEDIYMKKIVLLMVMLLTLAFSAVCSAASGKILDAEEGIVAKFMEGNNYKAISSLLSAEMQKNWDEKSFSNFHTQINSQFGKLTTNKLRIVEKFDDADVLTYQIIGEKVPAARFIFIFTLNGEKPLLNDLRVIVPQPKQEAPAGK